MKTKLLQTLKAAIVELEDKIPQYPIDPSQITKIRVAKANMDWAFNSLTISYPGPDVEAFAEQVAQFLYQVEQIEALNKNIRICPAYLKQQNSPERGRARASQVDNNKAREPLGLHSNSGITKATSTSTIAHKIKLLAPSFTREQPRSSNPIAINIGASTIDRDAMALAEHQNNSIHTDIDTLNAHLTAMNFYK
jgi:hypothetical protein